jgi:bud emergence protein 1
VPLREFRGKDCALRNLVLIYNFSIRTSQAGPRTPGFSPIPPLLSPTSKLPKAQAFYAVVLHDFVAERPDELDAKAGDNISVVAQSNREWFVAKPIGKLGRPGLIPVSFVEIRDPATNEPLPGIDDLMDRGELPKVEEWKQALQSYKQSSIALGVIEDSTSRDMVLNSPYTPQLRSPSAANPPVQLKEPTPPKPTTPACLPEGILLSADVVSFHLETNEYWFRIDAIYQPYVRQGDNTLPPAYQLVLFRGYNDFYDFQVTLLDTFPREAGRQPPHARLLPYMPGPVHNVTQEITATRRTELDEYMHKLCELSAVGARYILEHRVVREFLAQKPGDVQNSIDPRVEAMEALFGYDTTQTGAEDDSGDGHGKIPGDHRSDGSDYEDEGYAASPQRPQEDRHPYARPYDMTRRPSADSQGNASLRQYVHAQNHQRADSNGSLGRVPSPSPYSANSRSNSPLDRTSSQSQLPPTRWPNQNQSSPQLATSQQSAGGRSRSQSIANSNLNSPPISAANPQTAFVKIKIFDRLSDDLIAVRVHPRVSLAELMDKVQGRLGGEVASLRYRDSSNRGFVDINGDEVLRHWIETTDKHVLYAD